MKKLAVAATFSLLVNVALGTHDVGVSAIVRPETVETAVYYLSPLVMIHNFGSDPESYIPVRCWIDSAGVRVYDYQRVFAGSLPPGAESSHRFRSFDPGPVYFYYDLTVFTELASDEDRSNDTMRRRFYCSRAEIGDSMVLSEWVYAQVNGVIERNEYSRDQDILRRAGNV